MKVIVTGGVGFVGSNLCARLIKDGHYVFCIDNLFKGDLKNLQELIKNPNFKFINYDVVNGIPKNVRADVVYHLASPNSPNINKPKNVLAYPFETMLCNTVGTWKVIEFCIKNKAKFLFTSSSEVYGEPLEHPQKEEYRGNVSTIGSRSIYDEAKRFGETITAAFMRSKGLDGRIVRIFNTYGPNMNLDDGRVIIEFTVCALQNKPIPIFGNGRQTRSFCYITDLVEGLILSMNGEKTKGEVFNLGNTAEVTILETAKIIKRLTKSKSKIVIADKLSQDDPLRRKPNIDKALKILGWVPEVNFHSGLKLLIDSIKPKILELLL